MRMRALKTFRPVGVRSGARSLGRRFGFPCVIPKFTVLRRSFGSQMGCSWIAMSSERVPERRGFA